MKRAMPEGWKECLAPVKQEDFFKKLIAFLDSEYKKGKKIYPARENIFRALEEVDYDDVKVVILGQDPYHGLGQAIGRSFAVPNNLQPKPPSLQNIFKEMQTDLNCKILPGQSDLSGWVKQGVLLLNTVLTVEAGKPLSHRNQGWELFTDQVIFQLSKRSKPMVFILWGSHAQKLKQRIDLKRHAIIESAHPSPLSAYRGFFGSRVFSKVNQILSKNAEEPIHWERITD